MKKITRQPKHQRITIDKIENYKRLYNPKGEVIARWNYESNKILKEELLKMSNNECVYCGKKISLSNLDVEHFLPKAEFPYLAYSYLNLLPSCKTCNQNLKKSKYPLSLETVRDKLGESYLVGNIEGITISPFNKNILFNRTNDRIVDPSFDNPEEHLKFNPETCEYTVVNNSSIGKESKEMFFRENKEYLDELQVLSTLVSTMVLEGNSETTILDNLVKTTGFSHHIKTFYEYWDDIIN